jgi:hypothetical protein
MPRAAISLQDRMTIRKRQVATGMRVRTLPMALRGLWHTIVDTIIEDGADGVLDLGFLHGVRFGFLLEVTETGTQIGTPNLTHTETQIETLVDLGLLARPDADHLQLPPAMMPTAREISSKINGYSGGRPRKIRHIPGQTHLMMGIPGGRSEPVSDIGTETQNAPLAGAGPVPGSGSGDHIHDDPGPDPAADGDRQPVGDEEVARLTRRLMQVAGIEGAIGENFGTARFWLAAGLGFDVLSPPIRRQAEKMRSAGKPPLRLAVFRTAVENEVRRNKVILATSGEILPPEPAAERRASEVRGADRWARMRRQA